MFIFFDMDRTLVDFDVAADVGIEKLYELYRSEISMSLSDFNAAWKKWAQIFFDDYTDGKLTYDGQHYACVAKCFELNNNPISEDEAKKRYEIYSEIYKSRHALYDDVMSLLILLRKKNIPMGLITNGDSNNQRRKLAKLGVIDFFDPIVISSEVGVSKPDARIFDVAEKACAERMAKVCDRGTAKGESGCCDENVRAVLPEEIWYIGDSVKHDIEPTRARGWNTIFLNRKGNLQSPKIEKSGDVIYAEVRTLSQVEDVIFQNPKS